MDLIRALAFRDAKRPITKAVLGRIDLKALLIDKGQGDLWREEWESAWAGRARATPTD